MTSVPPPMETDLALSDEEIVSRVRAGQTALYEILIRRYNQRLYRVARTILQDDSEAEDVMQNTYVRAYEHLYQFAGEAKFATWLTKIAIYEALGRFRTRKRWAPLDLTPHQERAAMSRSRFSSNPEQETYQQELKVVLESAIDALPDLYRTVFVLRIIEDLEGPEVAECLGISLEAEKMRLHRAKALLRRSLHRRIGAVSQEAFSFHLARCSRIVTQVLERITSTPITPGGTIPEAQ